MCLAVPGKVLDIEERDGTRMATVDFGGVVKEVCLEYVPDLQVGEYAIVHVGFALQRLDEESARQTLALFEELGLLQEEFGDPWEAAGAPPGWDEAGDGAGAAPGSAPGSAPASAPAAAAGDGAREATR
ncbi:HypC/HybG/HupF family hydrogenase formation chaperone [Streptomyces decoyicus]